MRIVIVGAGQVGFNIARRLSDESKDVVLIDRNEEALKKAHEMLDCQVIHGSGSSPSIMKDAQIEDAEILIAVTSSDEINVVACLIASSMAPAIKKIARIRGEDYRATIGLLDRDHLGVDFAINPEQEAASRILRLLSINAASDIVEFGGGNVKLVGVRIREGSPVVGRQLMELRSENPERRILFAAIARGTEVIVPRGRDEVRVGDVLYVLSDKSNIVEALSMIGVIGEPAKRVMIYGGTKVGRYISQGLQKAGVKVKLIEENTMLAAELAVELEKAVVLKGSGADRDLLVQENVSEMDTFVSVSADENANVLVSLLAKHLGAKRVIALTDNLSYVPIVNLIGVDIAVSPRLSAVSSILQFVRKGNVVGVTSLQGEDAEALDVIALETSDIVGKPLKKINFPKGAIICAVEHEGQTIIPDGDTVIVPGDRVFIFLLRRVAAKVEKMLTVKLEYF